MRTSMKKMTLFALLLFLNACAFGNVHAYNGPLNTLNAPKITGPMLLAAQDKRPYITSHDKQSTFTGVMRSALGIPYDVLTKSGKPLAEDISDALGETIRKTGTEVSTAKLATHLSKEEVKTVLAGRNSGEIILIEINEWRTDTYLSMDFEWDINLYVLDSDGALMAVSSSNGTRTMSPDSNNRNKAVSDIFSALLRDEKVARAITKSKN